MMRASMACNAERDQVCFRIIADYSTAVFAAFVLCGIARQGVISQMTP